jgi:hypothetical protein
LLSFFVILLNSSLDDQYLAMSNPGNCDVSSFKHLLELEQDAWSFSQWRSPSVYVLQQLDSSSSPPNCAVGSAHGEDDEVDVEVEDIDDECSHPLDEVDDNADADGTVKLVDNDDMNGILKSADLHILQPGQVSLAYNSSHKESDLFHLFFTKNFLEIICKWSNEALISKGHKSCSSKEFFTYIGLEHGMSLVKYNDIKSYWASGCFVGHDTFQDCMSRTRFQNIRSAVQFSAQSTYDANMAHNDPL